MIQGIPERFSFVMHITGELNLTLDFAMVALVVKMLSSVPKLSMWNLSWTKLAQVDFYPSTLDGLFLPIVILLVLCMHLCCWC
jgi:hypothetical protein